MNVLVLNAGSSSLKYQLINVETHEVLAKGICERVGSAEAFHKHGIDENEVVIDTPMPDHNAAMALVLEALTSGPTKAIDSLDDIDAVGHRVVQGGKYFDRSVLIDDDVVAKIDELAELAPLHNKAALMGIEACEKVMPGTPNVAVFDTAFHQTMPAKAYMYALPYEYYENDKVRRYGFHGTSHKYVSQRAAAMLGKKPEELKLISCHLGNGSSIAAVDGGKSVDTSMGFTPLAGLPMGTRAGDLDAGILQYLMNKYDMNIDTMLDILNKKSGVQGVSGVSSDFRDLEAAAAKGHHRSAIALRIFEYRVHKMIAEYAAAMNGVDVVIFTAGVGENAPSTRANILEGLEFMGITCDEEKNNTRGEERIISKDGAPVTVMVIPTNEELMIAQDTLSIVEENKNK
mgnify:CR=1 FL=1